MRSALLTVAFLLAACTTTPPGPSGHGLSPDQFEDIPAPKSARYVSHDNQSFSYSAKTFRCGSFLYEYQGTVDDAVRFYKDTMGHPPYSWTLQKEDSPGAGSAMLVFTKNNDHCRVDIDRVPRPNIDKKNNVEIRVRVNYRD